MRLSSVVVAISIVMLSAACAAPRGAPSTPEQAVEYAFEGYRDAILATNGDAAADLVTEETWDFYRNLADQALTADRQALMATPVTDRITVLLLRHEMTGEQLTQMSGKEVFAQAVDRGWVSKDSASRLRLTDYRVDGDKGIANVIGRDGRPSKITMRFERQGNTWRVDVLNMLATARPAVRLAIALSGMSEEEFVSKALEAGTGQEPGPEIWKPLI